MNCFQIVFLLGSLTTVKESTIFLMSLWIAFKLYFYWVLWQPKGVFTTDAEGCELLSNCIFTGFFDNILPFYDIVTFVVNCFQIVFLLGSLTTSRLRGEALVALWIAFKLYFYWVLWQQAFYFYQQLLSCELLSNCIFTGFFDNVWFKLV